MEARRENKNKISYDSLGITIHSYDLSAMIDLYKALAAFQEEVPIIYKETKAYSYKYADMPTIIEAIKPLLKKHNLGYTQPLDSCDGKKGIRTILFHTKTGDSISGFIPVDTVVLKSQNEYQALGSGITYLRRYSLESILGLVTSKDDDAGGSSNIPTPPRVKPNLDPKHINWAKSVAYVKGESSKDKAVESISGKYKLSAINKALLLAAASE